MPPFIAPTRHSDPEGALAQVRTIYAQQINHLRDAMQRFVAGESLPGHVRACYPFVRIHTETAVPQEVLENLGLSYGFVSGAGRFETTLTRPDLYGNYYLEQFRLLRQSHGVELEVGTSTQPIPMHFSFAENDHIEGSLSPERQAAAARPVRPARPGRHGRRHRQRHLAARGPARRSRCRCSPRRAWTTRCTACGTTPARRPTGSRTSCCSPTTSSTSTSSCGWATRRWRAPTATTAPSWSRATWSRGARGWARAPRDAAGIELGRARRRGCRRCPPIT